MGSGGRESSWHGVAGRSVILLPMAMWEVGLVSEELGSRAKEDSMPSTKGPTCSVLTAVVKCERREYLVEELLNRKEVGLSDLWKFSASPDGSRCSNEDSVG